MTVVQELEQQLAHEEQAAGLRAHGVPSGARIRARRRQVALVSVLVLVGLAVTTMHFEVNDLERPFVEPTLLRIGMIALATAFLAYAWEREYHLQRVVEIGSAARAVHLAVADKLLREGALAVAREELHESLVLEQVLDRVLERGSELVGASAVAVRLVGTDGHLHLAGVHHRPGLAPPFDAALATRVALARRALRRDDGSAIAAPILRGPTLLGVLEAGVPPGPAFDDVDLEVLDDFAVRAAVAINNSRLYEDALVALEHDPD
jgi:GAF domain-containing protein